MSQALFLASLAIAVLACNADSNRDTLMELHDGTGGPKWMKRDGWGTSSDYCEWYGVLCTHYDPVPTVVSIALSSNGLAGSIPASLATKLPGLKVLKLDSNKLSGPIPAGFETLEQLQIVHLNGNELTGPLPPMMMNLTVQYPAMQEIDLSYNNITGVLSESFFGPEKVVPYGPADNLKVFNLRYNKLSGGIPERITRAVSLVSALFGGNNMTGVIPASLGPYLTARKYCDLSGNEWTCPLPAGVADKCQAACK